MELRIGDLVVHKVHGYHGIVVSKVGYWGNTSVIRVEWCESGKNNLIDIFYLDKISK